MILGQDRHLLVILLVCGFLAAVALFVAGRAMPNHTIRRAGIALAVLATAAMGLVSFLAWWTQPG